MGRPVALCQLMRQHGLGGSRWLDQFAAGFPITGYQSQRLPYDLDEPKHPRFPRDRIPDTSSSRFRDRSDKSGYKNASSLRDEAIGQVGNRWLLPPQELSEDGRPPVLAPRPLQHFFLFGVLQADKLRACEALKRSLPNLACAVATPDQLASGGHMAQISHLLASRGGDWSLFKADHEAAYKQPQIDPADQRFAIVALRRPSSGKWFGFVARPLISGSVADVLHYNISSIIRAALTNRCLGIPPVAYFDDFPPSFAGLLARRTWRFLPASSRSSVLIRRR